MTTTPISRTARPLTPAEDVAFKRLLDAFNRQYVLRRSGADIPALARGNQRLFNARMAMATARTRASRDA